MQTARSAATLHAMTDEEPRVARGRAIGELVSEERSEGKVTITQLARESGLSRQTIYNAIKGEAGPKSLDDIEAALERIATHQREHPEDYAASDEGDLAEVELHGVFGVERVIVRGRPGSIEAEVRATLKALREGMSTQPPSGVE